MQQIKHISGHKIQLFRHQLPSGVYYLKLTENNEITVEDKLIISND